MSQNELQSVQNNSTMEIIEPPPMIRKIVEKIALTVSQRGLEFEKIIKTKNAKDPNLKFLMSPDHPYHAFYQQKLTENLAAAAQEQDARVILHPEELLRVRHQLVGYKSAYSKVPQGTTLKELDTMKITAQFLARFGLQFWSDLKERTSKDPRFEFMNTSHSIHGWFSMISTPKPYVEAIRNKPRESNAYMATVLECFFLFLQRLEENDYDERTEEMDMFDWLEFMCGLDWEDFTDNPSMMLMKLTTTNSPLMPLPEPKREQQEGN